ncbi:WYL domain-containing protein [Lacihabitans sp. CCS-44]|uniref:helix-turn-helix transcriptional regulator n=1 Tax=Lacihabitans sp. CCS-44 TaxID=2487331 RepID=UPI0020CD49B5|nr:WYL domain-containing protein [Lacihabitans sp. CCS-44]MCP9755177.1 WYL domain-containing protein [Lacihabitans sp. CCS-44]
MAKKSDSVLRIRRIFEIHKILRNREGISAIDIVENLLNKGYETNERMVASDIADLRLLGTEISANRHKGYWYSKPFSMLEALEGVDSGNMNEILAFVRKKTNDELFKVNLAKLLIDLEQEVRNPNMEENPYIQFEKVELKNIEKLDLYYKYITEKRVLDIDYHYFGSMEPAKITIVPIQLREYNNRWALIGFSKEKNDYQNYALDRIMNERFSSESLSGKSTFDARNYYKDVIGNSVDKKNQVETIRFKVKKSRAYYVATKKWHHSQTNHVELEDSTSMTFSLRVIPNREFWAKVMEHIEDIEILEPRWMAEKFRERVRRVWESVVGNL